MRVLLRLDPLRVLLGGRVAVGPELAAGVLQLALLELAPFVQLLQLGHALVLHGDFGRGALLQVPAKRRKESVTVLAKNMCSEVQHSLHDVVDDDGELSVLLVLGRLGGLANHVGLAVLLHLPLLEGGLQLVHLAGHICSDRRNT